MKPRARPPAKPPRAFFERSTLVIARDLIGMHLVHDDGRRLRRGRIVETEAYQGPRDRAAHSSRGRTARTEVMFGAPGHAYVYFIYGFWNCLNVVTGAVGVPHAVLLRALEPLAGLGERTSGPGLLCRAMGIDRRFNGIDLLGDELWLEAGHGPAPRLGRTARIGVEYAGEWALKRWRFFERGSAYVSGVRTRARPAAGAGHAPLRINARART
ncbi:MAG TPA: DNA-3-methyladenine glycosylase [Candidatus Dormibacteraeota bacterium]|nr:DNA-3-methyladenine glycosylase [Candidatus Dormibacteraeota bacterium]